MKHTNKALSLALSLALLASPIIPALAANSGLSTSPYSSSAQSQQVLTGEVVSIAAGAKASGTVDRGFASDTARIGDRGYLTLTENLNGIPSGAKVEFEVIRASKAKWGRFSSPGQLQLKALNVIYPNGKTARLNGEAYITDNTSEVVLKGSTKGERVRSTAIATGVGAGTGALGGLVGAALSKGSKGRGTVLGTAVGAGIGVGTAAIKKGDEVNIKSGEKLFLKFTQSATIAAN
jgi:hypothetical protein